MKLPDTLIHWLLFGSAAAAISFFCAGLTTYFERRQDRPAWVRAIHDAGAVLSLSHLTGVLLLEPRSDRLAAAGIVLYLAAIALFLAALEVAGRTRLQRSFTDYPLPDRLLVGGPYGWVRHPIYLGYLLGALAPVVAIDHIAIGLIAVVMIGLTLAAAFREEQVWLASPRAAEYREYRRRTGMFLPFIGRR